jgi:hypothetical protein
MTWTNKERTSRKELGDEFLITDVLTKAKPSIVSSGIEFEV